MQNKTFSLQTSLNHNTTDTELKLKLIFNIKLSREIYCKQGRYLIHFEILQSNKELSFRGRGHRFMPQLGIR